MRRGWSVGRVLFPGVLRRAVRRPSISGRRCRRPRAAHPRTRAGSPRACAVRPCSGRGLPSRSGRPDRWWSLAPPFHPYLKHCFRRSVLCGTVPRVTPGGCCPPPCPSEPGPSSTHSGDRVRRGRPTNPSALAIVGPRGVRRHTAVTSAVLLPRRASCAGSSAAITPRYWSGDGGMPGRPCGGGRPGVPGGDYGGTVSSRSAPCRRPRTTSGGRSPPRR
jgi:hypothetical protein